MTSSPSKKVIVLLYIDYIVKGLNPGSYSTYLRIVYSRLNEPYDGYSHTFFPLAGLCYGRAGTGIHF